MPRVGFEVGQQYENRKGTYEVLAMDGDAMRIRWDTGEEIDVSEGFPEVVAKARVLMEEAHTSAPLWKIRE